MKKRLDLLLQTELPHLSRNQIASLIMQGKVKVEGKVIDKPGTLIKEGAALICDTAEPKFVSRAGFKLEKALDYFGIDVHGLVALDAGISTGGFSDCLLQRGIKKIYGVDVGYGQVHEKVAKNPLVTVIERTNLKDVQQLPDKIDIVTLDLSFISVLKVMPAILPLLQEHAQLIILIKPQFEAGRENVGAGGIVRDAKVHQEVIDSVVAGVQSYGFVARGVTESPIEGATGNKEFLGYFTR